MSRKRLSQKMLIAHVHHAINGPNPGTRIALEILNKDKEKCKIAARACLKLPKELTSVF